MSGQKSCARDRFSLERGSNVFRGLCAFPETDSESRPRISSSKGCGALSGRKRCVYEYRIVRNLVEKREGKNRGRHVHQQGMRKGT